MTEIKRVYIKVLVKDYNGFERFEVVGACEESLLAHMKNQMRLEAMRPVAGHPPEYKIFVAKVEILEEEK